MHKYVYIYKIRGLFIIMFLNIVTAQHLKSGFSHAEGKWGTRSSLLFSE